MRLAVLLLGVGCYQPAQLTGSDAGSSVPKVDAPPDAAPPTSPRKLTILDPSVNTTVSHVPILIKLDPSRIDYSIVNDPTLDLEFIENGKDDPFEVVSWNPGGVSEVWVKATSLVPGTPTEILMYFGEPGIGGGTMPPEVWLDYELVAHLDTLDDASRTFASGSRTAGGTFAPGEVGNAAAFDAKSGQGINFPLDSSLFDGWQSFTMSFWIYPDYIDALGVTGLPRVFDQQAGFVSASLSSTGTEVDLSVNFRFAPSLGVNLGTPVDLRQWNWIACEYEAGANNLHMLKNDAVVAGPITLGPPAPALVANPTDDPFAIGVRPSDAAPSFAGLVDEVRIGQVPHTDTYLKTTFHATQDTIVTYGDFP